MVTIKQLADEIGVSKTAISKKINKLGLREQLTMANNQWFIPDNLVTTIKESFSTNSKAQTVSANQSQTVDTLVCTLREQIAEKDKQIATLQEALINAQKLQGIAEQKLLALEDKNHAETEIEPTKKGFWERLFSK